MKDTYQTIAERCEGEFRDRGSKFIAYAEAIYTEEEGHLLLDEIKKLHPKSRHFCYAYRLGMDGNQFRTNDDGEPSGTAGRPILGQIDSFELTNVFVVVIRYFGGTKLGTSGLINAYKTATQHAFEQANIIEKVIADVFRLEFNYAIMSQVMNAVKKMDLEIRSQSFENSGVLELAIRQTEVEASLLRLKALVSSKSLEEVASLGEDWELEGFELKKIETDDKS